MVGNVHKCNNSSNKYTIYDKIKIIFFFSKDEILLKICELKYYFNVDNILLIFLNKFIKFNFFFSYFLNNWLLTTNHKRISVLYFVFIIITSFVGLILATIIRVELAYPGRSILNNNSEKYLTIISLHGIVMVFFVVIPAIFGAFGNFLLPTQLCVRDVAFPRLNSFMFWVTPSGFILILHIFFYDKNPYSFSFQNNLNNKILHNNYILKNKSQTSQTSQTITNNIYFYKNFFKNITIEDLVYANWSIQSKIKEILIKSKNKKLSTSNNNFIEILNYNFILFFKNLNYNITYFNSYKNNTIKDLNYIYINKYNIKVSSWVSNQLIPGWALITPYSSRVNFSALGKIDLSLIVIFSAGLGSLFSSLNYIITYKCLSSNSILSRRELRSFFVDSLLVASRMMLAANPALLIAILFLLSDRHLGTTIFDFSGGGDAVLFQHLFWFFGHPEVYIIIIPCFGFVNSLLPFFLKKRLSGRLSLQFSMYTIAFMGFAVWGHHMYMVGLANTTRTLYSTMTVMISVPASTKVLHWCVTLINSSPQVDVSFLFLLAFIYFFTLGGLSGMFVAHIGFDILFHDTFYVIGHFHVMLAGAATSCIFSAFYFYFSAITNLKYSNFFGYLHFFFYFFGQLFTVIPMFWLGYSGMPRRIMDYPSYFGGWHSIISGGHILSLIGYFFFFFMILDSIIFNKTFNKKQKSQLRLNNRLSFYISYVSKK